MPELQRKGIGKSLKHQGLSLLKSMGAKRAGADNKELKRRIRVVGAFPNDASLLRIGIAILMDINDQWLTDRKYLSMDEE